MQKGKLLTTGKGIFLILGVLLFNSASAYTTKCGLDLIFHDQVGFGKLLSWCLAIGCALFLVLLTFEVASRKKGSRIGDIIFAYLVIAGFSIFCNFSYIYSSVSARSVQASNYRDLSSDLTRLVSAADLHLRNEFKLGELEEKLSRAKVDRQFEADRFDRPGEGPRWLLLDEEVRKLEGTIQLQNKRFSDASAVLRESRELVAGMGQPATVDDSRLMSRKVLLQIRRVISQMQPFGFHSSIDVNSLEEKVNSDTLEYNLKAIFDEVGLFMEGRLDRLSSYRFIISLFLSIVLDTALFIVVAVRRPDVQGELPSTNRSSDKRIWDEQLW